MQMQTNYSITVLRCEESGMLVGTSTDIPGLTVEAENPHALIEAIMEVAPRLLMTNLKLSAEEVAECSISVKPEAALATKKNRRPHIFVDSELVAVAA